MTSQAATSVRSFVAATSVDEAIERRAELGSSAAYLAGGTDLGVMVRRRIVTPDHLIDVSRIDELHRVEESDDGIIIGAAVTHRTIEQSSLLARHARALQEACATVGSIQTRTVGTIGGNLCNASPAADTAPVLMAFDAVVEIAGPDGRRTVPVTEFFTGYRSTVLEPNELLVSVTIPTTHSQRGSAFLKMGRRAAMEISIVCAAVRLDLEGDSISDAGVGLGSVGPIPVRSHRAGALLEGAAPVAATWDAAGQAAVADAEPIDDVRASAAYRTAMIPVLVSRAAAVAADRAGGAS